MLFPRKRANLYLAVAIVNLLYVSTGCVLTWPSPVLSRLVPEALSPVQGSWVGSLMALGAAFGPPANSWGILRVGRRGTLLATGVAYLLGWVLLASSTDFLTVCLGRLVGGLAMGLTFIGIPIYLTEIADDKVRQAVTTLTEFYLGIGYLIVYIGGPYINYLSLQFVCGSVTLVFLVIFYFLPESPHYLLMKNKDEEAAKALAWFRNSPESEVQHEINTIKKYMEGSQMKESLRELLRKPGHLKSLLLSMLGLVLQQLSGVIVLICFLEPILDTIQLPMDPSIVAIVVGCANLPSLFLAPPMVRVFGTKKTLVICSTAMALAVGFFTVYVVLDSEGYNLSSVSFVPVICLFAYNIFFCSGLGPLTWSVAAELTPSSLKGFTTTVASSLCWIVAFALLLAYVPVSTRIGGWPVFAFFTLCLVIGTALLQLLLPDTKGMSLSQIQDVLAGRRPSSRPSETPDKGAQAADFYI